MAKKMIDIHTHILPGVDDGSKSMEESIEIIRSLEKKGIAGIVFTPHYIDGTEYCKNYQERIQKYLELKNAIEDLDIQLYLGNEVMLSSNTVSLLQRQEISTIHHSRYLLVELPLHEYFRNYQDVLCELNSIGIIPIIAHPERYSFLQKDPIRIREILQFDCLLQCNLESLSGRYGRKSRKIFKWLLKNDLVTFVASDIHHLHDDHFMKNVKRLERVVGKEKANTLLEENPSKLLRNESIPTNLEYIIREHEQEKKKEKRVSSYRR